MSNKTFMKKQEDACHEWYVVNVDGKVLGRAATEIAILLIGKHRPDFTPHVDNGAGVIVTNCDKIRVTGRKPEQKVYTSFSGYPGGLKKTAYEKVFAKNPKNVIRNAVKGMLPKSRLGVRMFKRLKVYEGAAHPHAAQMPKEFTIK